MLKKPNLTLKTLIFWVIIGTLLGWQLNATFGSGASGQATPPETLYPTNGDMSLFWDVWEEIDEDYIDIDELEEESKIYGAIKGVVESLDGPYSGVMDPEETESFEFSLNGELEGIGAELPVRDGKLVIV